MPSEPHLLLVLHIPNLEVALQLVLPLPEVPKSIWR